MSRAAAISGPPLFDISVLALCAVISGAEGWDDRSTAPAQADWLKEFLDLTHGILSPDAFCRVFFQLNRTAIHSRVNGLSSTPCLLPRVTPLAVKKFLHRQHLHTSAWIGN